MRGDNLLTGFLAGIVMPLFGIFVYALIVVNIFHPQLELGFFLRGTIFGLRGNIAPTLSLSLLANVVLFFWFDHRRMLKAMRGVLGSMFVYGIVIVVLLLLWGRDFM